MGFLAFAGKSILAYLSLIIGIILVIVSFFGLAITKFLVYGVISLIIGLFLLIFGVYMVHAAKKELPK